MVEEAKNLDSSLEEGMNADQVPEATQAETNEPGIVGDSTTIEVEVNAPTEDEDDDFAIDDADDTPLDSSEFEAVVAALQQEIANLRQQLNTQNQNAENFKAQYMRIAADFENFRKRSSKEKEEVELRTKCNTVNEILAAVDNFERARLQIKPANDGEMTIHKSYQGVYKQLVEGLKKIGVSAMRPEGEEFDPNYHEAIFQEPTNEYPEGTVIEQVVRGYILGDKVLRHAMVKVAAPSDDDTTGDRPEAETSEEN